MLSSVPLLLFVAVLIATLVRGRAVRKASGRSAWAFTAARGLQRIAGAAFALSGFTLGAAAIVVALAGDRSIPALAAGSAFAALGALIVVVAQVQMGAAWRVGVRDGDAPLFITAGLFRFSRNPIFVGMILMAAGIAVAAGSWWAIAAAAIFAIACDVQTRVEEVHLSRAFGAAYDDFRHTTPRWLLR